MKLLVSILTAPRPASLLERTYQSLVAGGFERPWVFDGSPPSGERPSPRWCTAANVRLYRAALERMEDQPDVEGLLAFEDDVIVCQGAAHYLAGIPWPEELDRIALASPYCPEAYSNYDRFGRWHREDQRSTLAGSQAWIFPRHALQKLAEWINPDEQLGIDVVVGAFARAHGLHVWYHVPSLAQHIGICNSAVGYTSDLGTIYKAATFPGEDFDARRLP